MESTIQPPIIPPEAIKKVTTGINKGMTDSTDDDPMDPGQAYLTMIYKYQKVPTPEDYKFAKRVSKNKVAKFVWGLVIGQVSFWIYLIMDFAMRLELMGG